MGERIPGCLEKEEIICGGIFSKKEDERMFLEKGHMDIEGLYVYT